MNQGYLILLLHAHLPWVRHPEYERSLEEAWLYEAAMETYIPLLDMLNGLSGEGIPYRLTLSLSPTLLSMLDDPLLRLRFGQYLERHAEFAGAEVRRTTSDSSFGPVARMYAERASRILESCSENHSSGLVNSFQQLAATGHTELLTTAATHAYLPNLSPFPRAVETQIRLGIETFHKYIGTRPRGLWLPECGYYDGLDRLLARAGVEYFIAEGHGLMHASPRPPQGVYQPVSTGAGPAVYGRDVQTIRKVWNSSLGYPGDAAYRDFYRDAGFDLPLDYVGPYLHPEGIRNFTGMKYYRITGTTSHKEPYSPALARDRAREHARDFVAHIETLVREISSSYGFTPVVVAPFDAELFGHWWFEGIWWLEDVLRELAASGTVQTITPSEHLAAFPALRQATLSLSSWGEGGYGHTWAHGENALWLGRLLKTTARLDSLLPSGNAGLPLRQEVLSQAAAELLLAQASDWPFMVKNRTFADYARMRMHTHLMNADALMTMTLQGNIDRTRIEEMRERTPGFTGHALDYWRSLA